MVTLSQVGVEDYTIRLWDAVKGAHKRTLTGHTDWVNSVAFSPDGNTLASGSYDETIRLWDAVTGAHKRTLTTVGSVISMAFSPDGRTIASGSWGYDSIDLWDAITGTHKHNLTWHITAISVSFSPNGRTIAGGNWSGTIYLWDAITGVRIRTLTGHTGNVESVAFSPDGSTLASGNLGYDSINLWDAITGVHIRTLTGHTGNVESVAFSPDGSTIASASWDDTIRLWDAVTGAHKQTLTGHTRPVNSVSFSPDGSTLASGSWDHTIRLWDAATGAHKQTLTGHTGGVLSVSFSPDGSTIASGSWDHTIRLWDAVTGAHKRTLTGHTRPVNSVVYSPDGKTLASGEGWTDYLIPLEGRNDNTIWTIRLWNAVTGVPKRTLTGHTDDIESVAFSPNGRILASGSDDGTIRLWDAASGAPKRTFTRHTDDVESVSFSPDGRTIASGSGDGTILLWELTPSADTSTIVSASPSPVPSPGIGEQLTVSLKITDGKNVAGFQATVGFDTSALRYIESANGDYLPAGAFFATPVVTANKVALAAASLSGESNGDGTLATVTFEVIEVKASTLTLSDVVLSDSAGTGIRPQVENGEVVEPPQLKEDLNHDGVVNIQDLVLVVGQFGQTGANDADMNGDGVVNIQDLVLVVGQFGNTAAAPSFHPQALIPLTAADVEGWLTQAQQIGLTDPAYLRGIAVLEQLLAALTPKETVLLPNYPNPFNPETWIPYRLAEDGNVTLTIYDGSGQIVRTLEVGHRIAAVYESRDKAIYWDGRNNVGERVASGVYFYTLIADDFSATRKMLILR